MGEDSRSQEEIFQGAAPDHLGLKFILSPLL